MKAAATTALIVSAIIALPAFAQTNSTTPSGQPSANTPAATTPSTATTPGAPASSMNKPMTPQASSAGSGSMFVTTNTNLWRASKLENVAVYNDKDEKIGEIDEVLVDSQGRIAALIVSVGGFLGMGERHVAVSFDAVRWQMDNNTNRGTTTGARDTQNLAAKAAPERAILAGATKEQLKNAPEYKYKS